VIDGNRTAEREPARGPAPRRRYRAGRWGRLVPLALVLAVAWLVAPAAPEVLSGSLAQEAVATPTPVQRPGGRFQEDDPLLQYTGAWTTVVEPRASGGAVRRASARGASVEFTFPGAGVGWVTTRGPDRGIAHVFVDDQFRFTVDLYASEEQFQTYVVSFLSLASDQDHTIRIVVTGERRGASTGTYVDVDAFLVGAAQAPDTLRFEDSDPAIRFLPVPTAWTVVSDGRASGGMVRRASQAGAAAEFTFTGPSILWFTSRGPDRGRAQVTIDGQVRETVDLYRSTVSFQETFLFDELGDGTHTIRIDVTGTRSATATDSIVDIDAFVVTGAPAMPAATPVVAPTATRTPAPTATPAATPTPTPAITPTSTATVPAGVTATPSATPAPAPPAVRDARYFSQTSFRIDDEEFWRYFESRGGVSTFGYPVSRTFPFLGCTTQFFQRHVLQRCQGGGVQLLNLLDPDLMPATQINGSMFPAHDPAIAAAAPPPQTPNYSQAVLAHLIEVVPSTFEGLPVDFFATYMETVPPEEALTAVAGPSSLRNLEIWGFPTSAPAFDPNNRSFVYQRFQRGIMHYRDATGTTEAVLLGDYFKSLITGRNVPGDLAAQAQATGSSFRSQYCPGQPRSLCRAGDLAGTDFTAAFEPQ
jgi:hypothetical protein